MILNVIEDVCYFLGVHIRLSIRCKMFYSKITLPFPQNSGLKVYCLIEIINLLIGASLLALAKSIY